MNRHHPPVIMNVVGARPQFIKAGPVSRALAGADVVEYLVHTGQHYDTLMSERIMEDIGLRQPDVNLGVGSGSHGRQTAMMLEGLERVLLERPVDAVLTYGDTNSTVAAALAATKLGIFTAHVEAGLRSFNRRMPEELNRIATDHLSDLLLAPTVTAMAHLENEGLSDRSVLTGDVMVDALGMVDFDKVAVPEWATGDYMVATIHRAENTDDPQVLGDLIGSLEGLGAPVHLLAHPRLKERMTEWNIRPRSPVVVHEPLGYTEMLGTIRKSRALLTDSGGLQKEAFVLKVRCITLREETEWPETLVGGWNVLASPGEEIAPMTTRPLESTSASPFGDGRSAARVVAEVLKRI